MWMDGYVTGECDQIVGYELCASTGMEGCSISRSSSLRI